MIVYIQWTRANPQDWEAFSITSDRDWRDVIKDAGAEPATPFMPGVTPDDAYVYDLEVQGVQMSGADHMHVTVDGGSLVVTRWNDDPVDWLDDRYAHRWTFRLPVLDGRVGRVQPRQSLSVWAEAQARKDIYAGQRIGAGEWNEPIEVADWSAFVPPGPANMVVHGIWADDALSAAHVAARGERGWTRYLVDGG